MSELQKNLPQEYLRFLSEVTVDEFLRAKEFVDNTEYTIDGGVFTLYQLGIEHFSSKSKREEYKNILDDMKIIYKLAGDKDYQRICCVMQIVLPEQYAAALQGKYGNARQHISFLKGEFPDYVNKKLRRYRLHYRESKYWTTLISQLLEVYLICLAVSESSQGSKSFEYMEFISHVTRKDYLEVKEYFDQGNDIDIGGGVMEFCRNAGSVEGHQTKDQDHLLQMSLPFKTVYKLAKNAGYETFCSVMESTDGDRYSAAMKGLDVYTNSLSLLLEGEFMQLIDDSLESSRDNAAENLYWYRLKRAICAVFRLVTSDSLQND